MRYEESDSLEVKLKHTINSPNTVKKNTKNTQKPNWATYKEPNLNFWHKINPSFFNPKALNFPKQVQQIDGYIGTQKRKIEKEPKFWSCLGIKKKKQKVGQKERAGWI